jgi:hypothetical protein
MNDPAALSVARQSAPVASLSDAELSHRLMELNEAIDGLVAERREVIGEWDHRGLWSYDGARSGAAWLAHHGGQSRARAGSEVKVSRRLRAMPKVAEASGSGALCSEKVEALARATDHDPSGRLAELFARDEELLVGQVAGLSVDHARTALRHWRACADDQVLAGDVQRQHDSRWVSLVQTMNGMWDLTGRFEAHTGAMIHGRLAELMEQLRRAERATLADGERGTPPLQRRADALVELVTRAPAVTGPADGGEPVDTAQPKPLLLVDVPLEALEDRLGRPATLADGTPLAFETIARLACESGVMALVTRAGRLTVDLGRTTYTPSRSQRRALARRDRGCCFPGCDLPVAYADAHHLWHWTHGGPTALWNLVLLCRHHHHLVHEGGFRLVADQAGWLHAYRPDGTEINAPPGHEPHRIEPRPPGTHVPARWSAPVDAGRLPFGATAAGTAPPGGWDPAHPPDPDIDELAYRRWQDDIVRRELAAVVRRLPARAA